MQNEGTERNANSMEPVDGNRAFALAAAPLAAAVANYCDHVEHNEPAEPGWVIEAGERLTIIALELAATSGRDLVQLYAARLASIETGNVLAQSNSFDGGQAALAANTWRELQLVQSTHDRTYHPDVVGMSRLEQLRHYAFHLTKIVGAFAEARDDRELIDRRLPDALLFAIKLRTVMGSRLPNDPLPRDPKRSGTPTQ
jgi:hypothetical protein